MGWVETGFSLRSAAVSVAGVASVLELVEFASVACSPPVTVARGALPGWAGLGFLCRMF